MAIRFDAAEVASSSSPIATCPSALATALEARAVFELSLYPSDSHFRIQGQSSDNASEYFDVDNNRVVDFPLDWNPARAVSQFLLQIGR